MAYKRVEDMLKHPETITADHNCNFGSPLLKMEGLLVAKGMHVDFNAVIKLGLQLAIKDFKRKNKTEWDALVKQYGLGAMKKR